MCDACVRLYARASCLPLTVMLNLVRAFTGAPSSKVHCLSLPTESLLVSPGFSLSYVSRVQFFQIYPSADTVVILDAISLCLVRSLAFSQVFPGRDHASARITSLAVDSALKLVRASYSTMCFPSYRTGGHGIRPEACRLVPLRGLCSHLARPLITHSS